MKASGATEANPDFAQMSAILRAMQAQNMLKQQQQQHPQQQRTLQNGLPQVNGMLLCSLYHFTLRQHVVPDSADLVTATGRPPQQASNQAPSAMQPSIQQDNASSTPQRRTTQDSMNVHPSPVNSNVSSSTTKGTQVAQSFTADQLAILRHQIMAFKLISKNMPVPSQIQNTIFPNGPKPTPLTAVIAAVNATIAEATGEQVPAVDKTDPATDSQETDFRFNPYQSPWSGLRSDISYLDHGSREKRLMIPSIMPPGIDLAKAQEERERVIYNRISARRVELENLPSNLSHLDLKSENVNSDQLKIKALIEYKALGLLPKQRTLRQEVTNTVVHADNLTVTSNRAMYRRMKKQSLREARITEKLEKQQRDQREMREKKKHLDYLQSVITHGRDIQTSARTRQGKQQKVGRMMLQHHQHMEKEEQKRMERTAKQRLLALKANDEEAYLKLLDQAKDTRITHLLKQTDGFLNSLAEAVRTQQRDAIQNYGRPDGYQDESSDDEDEDGDKKIDYYGVAHRIQETITEQPSILVGGRLKEYQVKGLQWMVSLYNNNLNGILADEMGLGKTIQTISLVTFLIEKKRQNGPFLVIVPLR